MANYQELFRYLFIYLFIHKTGTIDINIALNKNAADIGVR